jgi:hypothetical protein
MMDGRNRHCTLTLLDRCASRSAAQTRLEAGFDYGNWFAARIFTMTGEPKRGRNACRKRSYG